MAALIRFNKLYALRNAIASSQASVRYISTSPKKSDTATIETTEKVTQEVGATISAKAVPKNYVYYGFETNDEQADKNATNATFFFSVTLCLVFGSFFFAYQPDNLLRDWSQREAYLELRRREAAGQEPISCDYIERSLMVLPSDEELGESEIII